MVKNLPAFTLWGASPQVDLLGHVVIPCVILEAPPRGLSRRPQRLRARSAAQGRQVPTPAMRARSAAQRRQAPAPAILALVCFA